MMEFLMCPILGLLWSGFSRVHQESRTLFQMDWEGEGRHCRQGALR